MCVNLFVCGRERVIVSVVHFAVCCLMSNRT